MTVFEGIDFQRSPYRGVISKVAKERGVSDSAIHQAMSRGNAEVVALISEKIREIQETLRQSNELSKAA